MSQIVAYVADYYPLLGHLMHQMGLSEAINEVVPTPPQGQDVDTGTFVTGMILNILAEVPFRMYRLREFFSNKPTALLFPWKPEVEADQFDDSRAERVLDDLWQTDPQKVFSSVVKRVIERYQPNLSQLHVDTTSKSFYRVSMGIMKTSLVKRMVCLRSPMVTAKTTVLTLSSCFSALE